MTFKEYMQKLRSIRIEIAKKEIYKQANKRIDKGIIGDEILFSRSDGILKANPDTNRIKNNPPNKNTNIYEEFSIEKIRKISKENKNKKDSEYEKEIDRMTREFKDFLINKIYSEASKGNFHTWITKDDFMKIFGEKYKKGYYPKIAKNVSIFLRENDFCVHIALNECLEENDDIFIEWEEVDMEYE